MAEYATGSAFTPVSLETESPHVTPPKDIPPKSKLSLKSIHHALGRYEAAGKNIEAISAIFTARSPFDEFFSDLIVSITPLDPENSG
jgi:hypothetical protein